MRLRLYMVTLLLLCGGCAGMAEVKTPMDIPVDLIDGMAAFGHSIQAAPVEDLLSVSTEMRAFVADDVAEGRFRYVRFQRLLDKMVDNGFFIDQYDRTATYSAARTFATRKGNCVAYTNMFIALAREANLDARYQIMHVQPTWEVESGYLVLNKHVNVYLEGIRLPGVTKSQLTVDFNEVQPDPDAPGEVISDEYAASMFYGNLAIKHLYSNEQKKAFAYLKRAILTEPANLDLWNNLGALYSILGNDGMAERAYRIARGLDGRDKTAISGLAKVLSRQGKEQEAQAYKRLALRYQQRNPYYHYALAEQAFRKAQFEKALASVNQAIELKRNNARFYALRAATAQELGDEQLAARSERLQRKHSKDISKSALTWPSMNVGNGP